MMNKRFFFLFSSIISFIVLVGTNEASSLYINTSNANHSSAANDASEIESVIVKVLSYVSMHKHDDPMIEVEPHIFVKKSNVEGIVIGDKTYYYSLFPHASFDPVAIGKVSKDEVTIIYDDEKAKIPVIIYTIN